MKSLTETIERAIEVHQSLLEGLEAGHDLGSLWEERESLFGRIRSCTLDGCDQGLLARFYVLVQCEEAVLEVLRSSRARVLSELEGAQKRKKVIKSYGES